MSDISNQYSDKDARDATHDKYTDAEAQAATHDRYSDSEAAKQALVFKFIPK